jgi:hypothetical protein
MFTSPVELIFLSIPEMGVRASFLFCWKALVKESSESCLSRTTTGDIVLESTANSIDPLKMLFNEKINLLRELTFRWKKMFLQLNFSKNKIKRSGVLFLL